MKSLILCAGYGTRLRPLTYKIPKPLVSVWGYPIIEQIIRKINKYGISEFAINLHHLGDKIERFLVHKRLPISFHFLYENPILDTGGAVKNARDVLSKTDFIIHNGDILTDFDLDRMMDFHLKEKNDITLAVMERNGSRKLAFEDDMRLCGWTNLEKQIFAGEVTGKKLFSFAGVHIVSPKIFKYMPDEDIFGIFDFYIKNINNLKIQGYPINVKYWFDIGSRDKLLEIRKRVIE
ncbi:MAG: nucleotidyltransferase family protein [Elusimicrobiota bacterium]